MKSQDQLSPQDADSHRVWEYAGVARTEPDFVRPVIHLPVDSLARRLVLTPITLANGDSCLGLLSNIDLADPAKTEHFLCVSIFNNSGGRFDLARYFDADYSRRDPPRLAQFLGLLQTEVFPMQYDISDVAVGHPDSLKRQIADAPTSRLSLEDLIDLTLT
jgi:hypothetical protein